LNFSANSRRPKAGFVLRSAIADRQPGSPSIINAISEAQGDNANLFVRGAVTDPKAAGEFSTQLFHLTGKKPDATVVPAEGIKDQFSFWEHELLKDPAGHAIIHDKIVVIDPFSPNCTVVTGSHNLGYRASYCNDENMLIITGKRKLAEAYAAHVLDVYDHYRFRYQVQQLKVKAWSGLETTDSWQDKYFAKNTPYQKEAAFWQIGMSPSAPVLPATTVSLTSTTQTDGESEPASPAPTKGHVRPHKQRRGKARSGRR
jgi:phosphatidylserine/phosphatidylglycerophosphate/cardiolipin synthase-like enzyme